MKCRRCKQEMTQDIINKDWYCDNCDAKKMFFNED